tara:strand:+ start:6219 stop:8645 length:2427 start_codon:yes stop_codon:yes gene_type:complete
MAEIKISNLDWFATLPEMQQNILHQNYPTDELKQGWFDLGKPFVYEAPYTYPIDRDPMTGLGPDPITKMVNFEINPNLGVLGKFKMERNVPLKEYKQDPDPANYTSLVETPYYMKTLPLYFTPAAPFAAGFDIAEGLYDFNPAQVAMSALGVNQISKTLQLLLAAGGIAGTPTEAEGITISKAIDYLLGMPLAAKGKPITTSANQLLKRLETDSKIPGGVGANQWREIRENLEEIGYDLDKVKNVEEVLDDIKSNNWTDNLTNKVVETPYGNLDTTFYKPDTNNKKITHNSQTSNLDSQMHQGSNNSKGVVSHTMFEIESEKDGMIVQKVLKLKEFQNDASSIIRFTGAKGTPKNDEYLRANKELWEAMQEQRALEKAKFVKDNPVIQGVELPLSVPSHTDIITEKISKRKFDAIINHPLFNSKKFEQYKLDFPEDWKKMENSLSEKGFIDTRLHIETRAATNKIFNDFSTIIRQLDPVKGWSETTGFIYREAPFPNVLNNPNKPAPWLQEEVSKMLDKAANDPNIVKITLPNAEEVITRWRTAGDATHNMFRNLYNNELPKVLKKMGIKVSDDTSFKYVRRSGEDPYNNLIDVVTTHHATLPINLQNRLSDDLQSITLRYRDGVPGRVLSLSDGMDGHVYRKYTIAGLDYVEGDPKELIKETTKVANKMAKDSMKSLGSDYINTLEEFSAEIIRVVPESEKAIDIFLDVYKKADKRASQGARKIIEKIGKLEGLDSGQIKMAIDDMMNAYSEVLAIQLPKMFEGLPPASKEILEKAGINKKSFKGGKFIELTPELRDKITNEGIYRN